MEESMNRTLSGQTALADSRKTDQNSRLKNLFYSFEIILILIYPFNLDVHEIHWNINSIIHLMFIQKQ